MLDLGKINFHRGWHPRKNSFVHLLEKSADGPSREKIHPTPAGADLEEMCTQQYCLRKHFFDL